MIAKLGGPAVLPDDRVVYRFAGCPIPDDYRLPLVGHPDCRNVAREQSRSGDCFLPNSNLGTPDFERIVLDQARLGEDLPQLLLGDGDRIAGVVKDYRPATGRALVEGK